MGLVCLALLALLPNGTYGYWAFNLICFVLTLRIAYSGARHEAFSPKAAAGLLNFLRGCVLLTFVVGISQIFSTPRWWSVMFGVSLGEGGRGAGLLSEPSLLAAPLALYLAILVSPVEAASSVRGSQGVRKQLLLEALLVIVSMVVLTRSISVLIIGICFAPLLGLKLKKPFLIIAGLSVGALVVIQVFGERIREALQDASGSAFDVISVGVGSWRNVPDLVIMLNFQDFLLPTHPGEVRDKIATLVAGWNLSFSWIENTYSTFAAGAVTLGLVVVSLLFVAGMAIGVRSLPSGSVRFSWIMLYVADWFVTPKYDAAGWVALGVLLLLYRRHLDQSVPGNQALGS